MRSLTEEDFQRLHPKLVASFRRLGASPEEAKDLVQETLLRAHKGLAVYEGHTAFDTWVISIAKNVWLQKKRDQGRQKRTAEEIPLEEHIEAIPSVPTEPGLEDTVIARDLLARVREIIMQLPEVMRLALILSVDGLKYRRIAEVLGVTEAQVSSQIHRARQELRRGVQKPPDVPPEGSTGGFGAQVTTLIQQIRQRHGELVDRKFAGEQTATETEELARLETLLDEFEGPTYAALKDTLLRERNRLRSANNPDTAVQNHRAAARRSS